MYQIEVVHVSAIILDSQTFLDHVIHVGQVEDREPLRSVVPDWNTWSVRGIDDHVQKPQDVAVLDQPAKLGLQNVVIDPIEILVDVALQHPAADAVLAVVGRHERLQPVKAEVCPFTLLTCVIVINERLRKKRFKDLFT